MNRKKFLKRAAFSVAALPLIVQSCKDESTTPVSSGGNTVCGDPITPAVPEGPYYVNEMLNRSAITEDRKGISLTILFTVEDKNCSPIKDAVVDIWHCDAAGKYSDESSEGTLEQKWLRGYQSTDVNGKCSFTTIFPGWYNGRLTHIHGKVKVGSTTKQTTNFFIPKNVEQAVYATALYAGKGQNPTTVAQDVELRGDTSRYDTLMMKVTGDITNGFIATYTIAYL